MESTQQQELERFFAEVAPRLDTAQTLDDELDRQLARRFNVFRYLHTDEMGFSRMIKDLLDPAGDHGQGAAFLKLLTDKLDFAKGVNLDDAKVRTERQIDVGRLDIAVEIDCSHCLAIENKSNNAVDQEGQVENYLKWLKREFTHSVLIYLSPTGDGPSAVSMDAKTIEKLTMETLRRFAIMPCSSSSASDDGFDKLRLPFALVDWLADCRRSCDVDRLRWYLREIETYCRQRYGGQMVTDSKKSAIANFLHRGTDSKNLTTAMAVYETWPEVTKKIKEDFWDLVYGHLPWDQLPEDVEVFHWGNTKNVYIYRKCWRPYVIDGQEDFTAIYMQADTKKDTDWSLGVWSTDVTSVSEDDLARREKLQQELRKLRMRHDKAWPCWDYVDEKYRDWNPLIPKLHEEVAMDGGEITDYFVGKFKEIVDKAIPIIDRIDGR